MKKILSYIILLFIAFSFYTPSQSFACSCMIPETPQKELERADYVFVGTVWEIDTVSFIEEYLPREKFERKNKKVTLNNITNIKWVNTQEFSLTTPDQSASCGINFQENKEYIVYAHQDDNAEVRAWLCSRTNLTEYAQEDLDVFAKILEQNKNQQTPIDYDDLPQNNYIKIILVLVWILLFSIVGIYKLSKKDSK